MTILKITKKRKNREIIISYGVAIKHIFPQFLIFGKWCVLKEYDTIEEARQSIEREIIKKSYEVVE